MQVQQVQTLEGLERQVDLFLSLDDIEAEVKKQLQQVARKAKIQGFRPGKAPLSVIERSHGPSVRYDVINQRVGQTFDEAIKGTELRVAGMPSIEPKESAEEGKLAFVAKFEVFPDVEIPALDALEVTKYSTQLGDVEVDRTIDILRKQRATYTEAPADHVAQNDDRLTVDFVGKIDGEEFAGGKAENFEFFLGKGSMLPEFEKAAEGVKLGESKTFELSFPEDYQGKEVAGKTAEFSLLVKKIEVPQLPELNEAFAKSLGQVSGDIAKLKEEILNNIQREANDRVLSRTKNSVMDALVKASDFAIPKVLIDNEVEHRIKQAREELKARGVPNADTYELPAELFKAESERRVGLGLLVSKIVEVEKLSPKPEQVRARIEGFSLNYEQPEQVVAYYLNDRQRRAEIEALVLEDNVVDFVLSKAKVTNQEVPFEELMGQV